MAGPDHPPVRVYLSPPDVGDAERALLLEALDSGWVAPVGPMLDRFESDVAARVGVAHAVAVSSGTAALHLALLAHDVGPGDVVLVPTLTFVASVNPVRYVGATPVLVDAVESTWQVDPGLVVAEVERLARAGSPPRAVVTVDLYGQCADHDPIRAACREHGVLLVEDAAEALGASYRGRAAGSLGDVGVLSFNGNKIITTSGGGMLLTDDATVAARVRHLATQAREPAGHYEHVDLGHNYRLSNLLAAVGVAQLAGLEARVARRRDHRRYYVERLGGVPGVAFLAEADYGTATHWLTVMTVDPTLVPSGASRDDVLAALAARGIEARPAWKPMHLQPLYSGARVVGGAVAERLFRHGLCLPSGSTLTDAERDEVADLVAGVLG